MSATVTKATSFLTAAGAIGLAGFFTRACPGGCTTCATCATALLPMGASAAAVGLALVGSARIRSRAGRARHRPVDFETPDDHV